MQLAQKYSSNARLKRDSVDKTLYIDDGGTLLTIVDEWGTSPSLEYSSTWEGGSIHGSLCCRKSDGTYCLAIKNTDRYMAGTMWYIFTDKSGSNAVFLGIHMDTIYIFKEVTFGQDMNGDLIRVDASTLIDITTDDVGNRLKKDGDGAITLLMLMVIIHW